jgi:hypothetical protein
MARKKDPNSVRQRAFSLLDENKGVKREFMVAKLMTKFNIGESYAATLYAAHRTINKENGEMAKVYTIKDIKDGKPVKPYLKVENTFNPEPHACLTPEQAKAKYELRLKNKIAIALQL